MLYLLSGVNGLLASFMSSCCTSSAPLCGAWNRENPIFLVLINLFSDIVSHDISSMVFWQNCRPTITTIGIIGPILYEKGAFCQCFIKNPCLGILFYFFTVHLGDNMVIYVCYGDFESEFVISKNKLCALFWKLFLLCHKNI